MKHLQASKQKFQFNLKQKLLLAWLPILFVFSARAQTGNSCASAINIDTHNCQSQMVTFSPAITFPAPNNSRWFSFTADSTQEQITVQGQMGSSKAKIHDVTFYSGTCTNLTSLSSYTLNPLDSQHVKRGFINLIKSNTYYIKVNYTGPYNSTQINICKSVLNNHNRTSSSCTNACVLINEPFTYDNILAADCGATSLSSCPSYTDPFSSPQNDIVCWGTAWGSPQVLNNSAFMWSQISSATQTAGEAILRSVTLNPNALYVLKYDYATASGAGTLDNLYVDVMPNTINWASFNQVQAINFNLASFGGGTQIDNVSSVTNTSFNHRQICFTGSGTQDLVFYPWASVHSCCEQYLYIDNVDLYEITATPTASNNSLQCGQSTTLSANPCSGLPAGLVTYAWSPATGLSSTTGSVVTASPHNTTTYTLTVSTNGNNNTGCGTITQTVTVNVATMPCAQISGGLCSGQTSTLSISQPDPSLHYQWNAPSGSAPVNCIPGTNCTQVTIANGTAGAIYSVTTTYTNCTTGNCCSCVTTISVSPEPICPTLSTPICSGQTNTLTISNADPNIIYTWNPAVTTVPGNNNNSQVIVSNPVVGAVYSVTATYANCFSSSLSKSESNPANPCCTCTSMFTVAASPTLAVTPTATTICSGTSVTLSLTSTSTPFTAHEWTTSAGTILCHPCNAITVTPSSTTTYDGTVHSSNGCYSTEQVVVTVNQTPPVPTFPGTLCTAPQLLTVSTPNSSNYNYTWSPGVSCLNSNCSQASTNSTGTYIVTATDPSSGCHSSATVQVRPTPNLNVTPTASTICSGTSVQLSSSTNVPPYLAHPEWATNTGVICYCNNITVTPSTTTTYTASVDVNGCINTANVIITVNPTPTISINDSPVPVICTQDAGSSAILNATSTIPYYSWTPATGLNNTTIANPTATPASTTIYTLTSTDPNTGCSAKDTVTVFVENCQCTKNKYTGTTITQSNATLLNVVVEHSFNNPVTTIIGNVTFHDEVFYFAPNCTLVVANNSVLTLTHCHLLACTDMWQGIIVQPGGKLIVQDSSMIEDAFAAINCDSWLQPATSNSLTVDGCVFNRNKTGIQLSNYVFANNFPATIKNAVFTGRTLPTTVTTLSFGNHGWTTSATPQHVKTTVAVPTLQTPYRLANTSAWATTTMKAPLNTLYSNYGIYLNSVGTSNTNGTAVLPSTYNDITVGNATAVVNNGNLNLFDGLYYGIYANTSNFTCLNNVFELMHSYLFIGVGCLKCPPPVNPYPSAGAAIYATNTALSTTTYTFTRVQVIYPGYLPSTNPNTSHANYFTPAYNNKFYDCVSGVNTINYQEVHVAGTDMRSIQNNHPPFSLVALPGSYGILANSPAYKYNYFRYNLITNINNGISFTASSVSANQSLGLVSADYNNITAYFNNNPTTQYVGNAIALDNSINCYSIPSTCQRNAYFSISANKNNIQNVYRGIEMMNWIGGHFGIRKTLYNISADTNYISLVQNVTSATATQFGINANHCYLHEININNIYGMSTSLVNNQNIRGIYPKDDAQSTVQCNSTTNVGRGFDFEGQSTGTFGTNDYTTWANNSMQNNANGFRLTNACILGAQGYSGSASDNQWNGTTWTGTNYGTYVDAASNAANSPLYVQSVSPYYPPNNSSANSGVTDYSSVPGAINIASASGYVCGTLPQPPCTRCPILNGIALAERVVLDSLFFPLLAAENSYKAQLKYFKLIAMNDTLADSSVVLQNFFASNLNSNLGTITAIESNLAQGNTTVAKSMNVAFAPSNVIENNYQKFYASVINVTDTIYSVTDSLTLITLANSCPATNGDVVYSARALYNAINNQYQYFEDNCNYDSLFQTPAARLSKKNNAGFTTLTNNQSSYLVYPNPTNSTFYISGSNANDKELYIEIQDLTGRVLSKQTLSTNNGVVTLQNTLVSGVYMVNIKGSDGKIVTKKLIVNN